MDEVMVGSVEQLYEEAKRKGVYIYGAKKVALRTYKYLEIRGVKINGYVVSNRYNNPNTL